MALPRLTPEQAALVEKHVDLPLRTTRYYFNRKGMGHHTRGIEFDDVHGAASEAFCKIAMRWDGDRTDRDFEYFAVQRLMWFITDFLRKEGPRRRRWKGEEGSDIFRPKMVSWADEPQLDTDNGNTTESELREQDKVPGHEDALVGRGFVTHVLRKCSKREQFVLWHHYVEGYTLRETAAMLNVSEPRISQIIARVLRRLRKDDDIVFTTTGYRRTPIEQAHGAHIRRLVLRRLGKGGLLR